MLKSEIVIEFKNSWKHLLSVKGLKIVVLMQPKADVDHICDMLADVSYKNVHFRIAGEVVGQAGSAVFQNKIKEIDDYAKQHKGLVPVIVAPYLSPKKQEACRRAGIYFIDLSGNIFLAHKSFYLERIGFPNKYPERRKGRSPFSDKASLILRVLLSEGDKNWGVRELAQVVELDPGFVSRMAKELEYREYIIRVNSKIRLRDHKCVLDDWVRNYDYRKNRMKSLFFLAASSDDILNKLRQAKNDLPDFHLSVQAGASLVAPHSVFNEVHAYVEKVDHIDSFKKCLSLNEAEHGANVILMIPYYKNSVLWNAHRVKGLNVVSDVQLYLDLYNYPLRGREQAEHLYDKRLSLAV